MTDFVTPNEALSPSTQQHYSWAGGAFRVMRSMTYVD
jgi:hypothetical protein